MPPAHIVNPARASARTTSASSVSSSVQHSLTRVVPNRSQAQRAFLDVGSSPQPAIGISAQYAVDGACKPVLSAPAIQSDASPALQALSSGAASGPLLPQEALHATDQHDASSMQMLPLHAAAAAALGALVQQKQQSSSLSPRSCSRNVSISSAQANLRLAEGLQLHPGCAESPAAPAASAESDPLQQPSMAASLPSACGEQQAPLACAHLTQHQHQHQPSLIAAEPLSGCQLQQAAPAESQALASVQLPPMPQPMPTRLPTPVLAECGAQAQVQHQQHSSIIAAQVDNHLQSLPPPLPALALHPHANATSSSSTCRREEESSRESSPSVLAPMPVPVPVPMPVRMLSSSGHDGPYSSYAASNNNNGRDHNSVTIKSHTNVKDAAGAVVKVLERLPSVLVTALRLEATHEALNRAVKSIAVARKYVRDGEPEGGRELTFLPCNRSNSEGVVDAGLFAFLCFKTQMAQGLKLIEHDQTDLNVSRGSNANTMANAVIRIIKERGQVVMKAGGAEAVAVAMAAIVNARRRLKRSHAMDAMVVPAWITEDTLGTLGRESKFLRFNILPCPMNGPMWGTA